jgi:endonuclease-8
MEGPSLVILKEETFQFKGHEVLAVKGYADVDHDRILHQKIIDIKTWGKHFLVCFKGFTLRIHFMLFGSYRINDPRKGKNASISLNFSNGEFDGYICKIKILEGKLEAYYDWSLDMLSPKWDPKKVKKILLTYPPELLIGDVLLDANLFSGVGNIIRNEVLYRVRMHPDSVLGAIPTRKLTAMIKQTQVYSFDFLEWKKANQLAKHWEVYSKKKCPLGHPITKKYTGKTKRRSFICEQCMVKYE